MGLKAVKQATYNAVCTCDKCSCQETYYIHASTPRRARDLALDSKENERTGWAKVEGKLLCPSCRGLKKCGSCGAFVKRITSRGCCISCSGTIL